MIIDKIRRLRCPSCDSVRRDFAFSWDHYEGKHFCDECGSDLEFHDAYGPTWVSIAVYGIDRAYGGPEEGGWYFDQGSRYDSTIRNFEVSTTEGLAEATAYYEKMKAEHEIPYTKREWWENQRRVHVFSEEMALVSTPRYCPVHY